jgi:hypothetical protein
MAIRAILLSIAILLVSGVSHADYLDVITTRLTPDCPLEKYMDVVEEFRGVITQQGYKYRVEIAVPFTNDELDVVYWLGREPDFATLGAENDRWEAAIAKGGTPEAGMSEKLNACGVNVSRSGHRTR